MYEHTLKLSFDVRPEFLGDMPQFLKLRERLHAETTPALASLDKHPSSADGPDVYALTERTCAAVTSLLQKIRRHDIGQVSRAQLAVSLAPNAAERAEWFTIQPKTTTEIDGGSDGLFDVRADRMKGREALRRYSAVPFVSQTWRDFVRDQRLTGIDFLWARDKGKYQALQWYCAFGTAFLGRGVDHPWFDPTTRGAWKQSGFMIVQPTDPAWLLGVRTFDAAQIRTTPLPAAAPELRTLIAELKQTPAEHGITIVTPPCVLRAFLPQTDFAYMRVAQPHDGENLPYRTVTLCCTAATRRKLLDARLAKPEDFMPIEVIDRPPEGVPVFDSKEGVTPPSVFTPDELAKVRKVEARHRAKFDAKPRPPMPIKPPEIKKLVSKLKRLLKQQDSPIAKGAKPDAIAAAGAAVGIAIPPRWAELLAAVDGFDIDDCYALDGTAELHVAAAEDLPETHAGARTMIGADETNFPATHLGVARSDIGDCIFLDTAKLTPDGDCPVLFMDHETLETVASWPAIGIFLSDALEASDA